MVKADFLLVHDMCIDVILGLEWLSTLDGQTKVVNRSLGCYLRCFTGDQPRRWSDWLHWAELSYNIVHDSCLNMSPFKAIYRCDPQIVTCYGKPNTLVNELDKLLTERDQMLEVLRTHLTCAQECMKTKANQHYKDI